MRGAILPLPHYASMAQCPAKKSRGTTLSLLSIENAFRLHLLLLLNSNFLTHSRGKIIQTSPPSGHPMLTFHSKIVLSLCLSITVAI
jgi:hypothetical protein